jgi:hypothetical protein
LVVSWAIGSVSPLNHAMAAPAACTDLYSPVPCVVGWSGGQEH